MRRLLSSILIAAALVGCTPKAKSGKVVSLYHCRSYYFTTYTMVGHVFIPIMDFMPERWVCVIEGTNKNGKIVDSSYNVYETNYNTMQIGDQISFE